MPSAFPGLQAAVLAAGGGTPRYIHRVPAQRLARRELARSIYGESFWQRIGNSINRWLNHLLGSAGPQRGGWWMLIVLICVAVLVIAGVLIYIGPARRSRRQRATAVLTGRPLSAADHRREADRLAEAGEYAGAIIERFRAIAVELESRDVLQPRPGRTASELAAEAADPVPDSAADLRAAALLFDDVRYGDRPGTLAGYQQVRALDATLHAARTPAVSAAGGSGPGPAQPIGLAP
jgi:hypothetical protein